MIRKILLLLAAVLSIATSAENYPYRTDALWIAQPDHADWIYKAGESPVIDIRLFRYGIPQNVEIEWQAADDLMPADESGKLSLKDGHAS
ncbi:MAG: acetylxylan esterase, partial [Muribaculaceae bacterium]|nr:acetylxylan esterase [Muribaculaceae bacterium]